MAGVTTSSYTQDTRARTGRRKKAWWCVLPRPKGYRSRRASAGRWRSFLLCWPFAVSRGAETKGPSGGRPARRGPSVIETRRVELALLGLASRGVVVGMAVKPRKAERAHAGEVFPNLVAHQPGTAISSAVRGTPNRHCGIAAVSWRALRYGHESRTGGATRRCRGEMRARACINGPARDSTSRAPGRATSWSRRCWSNGRPSCSEKSGSPRRNHGSFG
jgi:hypothetical protein